MDSIQPVILWKLNNEVWESPLLKNLNDDLLAELYPSQSKKDILQTIYEDKMANEDIYNYLRRTKATRNQMKQRWLNSALKELREAKAKKPKELYAEFLLFKSHYDMVDADTFSTTFSGAKYPEEIIENKIILLEKWKDDIDQSIIDYPYFKSKTLKVKLSAFELEITYILASLAVERYNGKVDGSVIERPLSLIDTPSFGIKLERTTIKDEVVNIDGKMYYPTNYEYKAIDENDDDFQFFIRSDAEITSKNNYINLPDPVDEEIYNYVMSRRDKNFARKVIIVEIGQIVAKVFKSKSKKNYEIVAKRLHNLAHLRFTRYSKDKSITFGLFDDVRINSTSWTADISINRLIVEDIIQRRTVSMYSDVIENFDSPLAKILIYALQNERVEFHSNGAIMENVYEYIFLHTKYDLKLGTKRKHFCHYRST